MQRTRIEVNSGSLIDGHVNPIDGNNVHGMIAYTAPLREYFGAAAFLTNSDGSSDLNVDASVGGTPDIVYPDEPTTNWTNTALSGTWDFGSTTITPQDGTESIDATATVNGSSFQAEKGSTVDLAGYASFSGYVYLTSWNDARHDIAFEVRLAGVIVGTSININDFIDVGLLNVWQKYVIPKGEMGLNGSTIDQLVFQTISTAGQPPNYYLDTISIEQSGSIAFTFQPAIGQIFEIDTSELTFSDNITVIEPEQIMGLSSLVTGIRFRTIASGVTRFSGGSKTFTELLSAGGNQTSVIIGAANSTVKYTIPAPATLIRLNGSNNDNYSIVLSDDYTGLTGFKALIRGRLLI
jgi:hypothetical protein